MYFLGHLLHLFTNLRYKHPSKLSLSYFSVRSLLWLGLLASLLSCSPTRSHIYSLNEADSDTQILLLEVCTEISKFFS